jgi:ABC-type transport system involved in cytochrome c biogenesis ATPase subunit
VLSVSSVDVFIQHSHILRQVSLAVGEREVVCLVGRNGAGKTTTLRTIMGYVRPRAGRVVFGDEEIHGRPTHEIARRGIGFAPEDSGIFADLTVAENIEIATWTRPGGRPAAERLERAYEVFPVLRKYRHRKGPEMSGGERKMLAGARPRPAPAPPRRAVRGALARDHPHGQRRSRRDHPPRSFDPARRVQHPPRPRVRHPPVRHRARRDHLRGPPGRGAGRYRDHADHRRGHVTRVLRERARIIGGAA